LQENFLIKFNIRKNAETHRQQGIQEKRHIELLQKEQPVIRYNPVPARVSSNNGCKSIAVRLSA
jgi:hypothetical protein